MKITVKRLVATLTTLAAVGGLVFAQRLPQPQPYLPMTPTAPAAVADDDTEVLARGPVHEAFASTAEMPTGGGAVIEKRPPDPVEELPPDQKPDGDNVQWIPGYWHWDDERKDFIWISGFWRAAPPGRVWVPGGWQEVRGGFQWVAGFWNVAASGARQAELEYLPPPPQSLETGPTVLSPGDDYFYTPGCWTYRVNRYVWRPGFWVAHRPNWVWVPDHYVWTPCGYVFVPGFWDEPLDRRGVLFAPVYFRLAVFHRPRFVYTPVYAVPAPSLYTSLFVRTGRSNYFFGDYFEQRYLTAGFSSWAGASFRGTNFAVTVGFGRDRGFTYDPLWSYYDRSYRNDPRWQQNIATVYAGRYKGDVARPPRTLVQQNNTVVNNVTNVTNNTNVIVNNKTVNAATPVAMLTPLKELKQASPTVALKQVQADDRVKEQTLARELRQVSVERRKAETQLVNTGAVAAKADDKPRQAKVELPKTAVARAQVPTAPEKAPPPPPTPVTKKVDPKPAPTVPGTPTPIPAPTQPAPGKVDPKPVAKPDPAKLPTPGKVDPPKPGAGSPVPTPVNPTPVVKPPVAPTPAVVPPKPTDPVKPPQPTPTPLPPKGETKPDPKSPPVTRRNDPPKVVAPATPNPVNPQPPVVKPPEPAKVVPAPVVNPAPKPVVVPPQPPKVDPPKTVAPPPMKVDAPKPAPVTAPPKVEAPKPAPVVAPPKVEVPKPAAVAPPKVEAPKSPPTSNFRSARPKDEKKDDKKK